MEFRVHFANGQPDLGAVEAAVLSADPAALVDFDATGAALRLAGVFTAVDVVVLMTQAGYPITPEQVTQLPSICCGGCSG
ncbi:hypothetical protein N800_11955 [Lysobacter daejeonensis GH1-9]|uniref:HMA domain-containing protein n=1 Tax=Lysobacter daejeonensis GH1-9 TaxID=1385517 RepID=A0A0A0EZV2_9GAMM|nr:hypothetical protein [Lysobacter daejeonensis]KGM55815.1 hypothetical protein N800_11955 [Lysobacter daejeonensis GH1-9]